MNQAYKAIMEEKEKLGDLLNTFPHKREAMGYLAEIIAIYNRTREDSIRRAFNLFGGKPIPVSVHLPPMFQRVIAFGVQEKINVCASWYEARRWTGFTSGWPGQDQGKEPPFEWLTPCDAIVDKVTHWFPIPFAMDLLHEHNQLLEAAQNNDDK